VLLELVLGRSNREKENPYYIVCGSSLNKVSYTKRGCKQIQTSAKKDAVGIQHG